MKLIALSILSVSAAAAQAQPVHAIDVIIKYQNGKIIAGRVDNGVLIYGPRLVAGTFGDTGIPDATFNPGFDSEVGSFPIGQTVGFTIRKALRKWNDQDFSTIPAPPNPAVLNLIKNNITVTTPTADPANCGVGDSLVLGLVNGTGKIHEHPAYQLIYSGDPTGVYLLEIQVWMTDPATAVSDPEFILLNENDTQAHVDAAFAWTDTHLAGPFCYANCDGSTASPMLTANDFQCFLNKFATASCDANCDGSTASPVLTANDFQCFLNKFAAGCS